jgi:low-affinity ferrous iron transport protein
MILTFILLANVGQRHTVLQKESLEMLFEEDARLEVDLRRKTHDVEPNKEVSLSAPVVGRMQRAIFYYADFVGTLVGIAILTTVICVWVAIGPALQYSSNWWLLIGTYAGLIGMVDGFVLRNMQRSLRTYSETEMASVHRQDLLLLDTAGLSTGATQLDGKPPVTLRISQLIDRVTSHEGAVAFSVAALLGLVAGSTAMHWSLTGQLLSNVPPSIIESWLMLTLITGHNMIEENKRKELQRLYTTRLRLREWLHNRS